MTAEGLRAFFDGVGYRTVASPSGLWYEAGPRFLLSLPSHRCMTVPDDEIAHLLRSERLAGLRYICGPPQKNSTEGPDRNAKSSFQIVATGSDYSLERLSANSRSKVRRGLKRNEIRQTNGEEVIANAETAYRETMKRQGRESNAALQTWKRLMQAADHEDSIEIWSAWHEGELASYLLVMFIDDVCEFYQARSANALLRHYPNNALVFSVAQQLLVERGIREITFGIESPEDVEDLDKFKWSLGFEKKAIGQRVVFHPALRAALAVPGAKSLLNFAAKRPGAHVVLRKAAGLACFGDAANQGI